MANKFYGAVGVSGGSDGFLDNIDGTSLADGDGAFAVQQGANSAGFYSLDADSAAAQAIPTIMQPDANGGDKRWILRALQMTGMDLYEPGTTNLFQFSQSAGDVIMDNTYDGGTITLRGEDTGNKTMLVADPAGALSAYYAGVLALTTAADGAIVYDTSGDSPVITFKDDAAASQCRIVGAVASMSLQGWTGAAWENFVTATHDAGVALYYNNVKQAETGDGVFNVTNSFTIDDTGGMDSILDEDDLSSDSATALATQQSIKAYVDTTKPKNNYIINGDFLIFQRAATGALTDGEYGVDRWSYNFTDPTAGVNQNVQGATVPTVAESGHHSEWSGAWDITTGFSTLANSDYHNISYKMEGYDLLSIWGKEVTLSFWTKAYRAGTYCVNLRPGGFDSYYVKEYTITADTWEKHTMTFTLDDSIGTWAYDNTLGLDIGWCIGAGSDFQTATTETWTSGNKLCTSSQTNGVQHSDDIFRLSQVKLEIGPTATPFTSRPFESELSLCQRYYEKSYRVEVDPGSTLAAGMNQAYVMTTNTRGGIQGGGFAATKRGNPTVVLYGTLGTADRVSDYNNSANTYTVTTLAATGANRIGTYFQTSTAMGSVEVVFHWTADSEL